MSFTGVLCWGAPVVPDGANHFSKRTFHFLNSRAGRSGSKDQCVFIEFFVQIYVLVYCMDCHTLICNVFVLFVGWADSIASYWQPSAMKLIWIRAGSPHDPESCCAFLSVHSENNEWSWHRVPQVEKLVQWPLGCPPENVQKYLVLHSSSNENIY